MFRLTALTFLIAIFFRDLFSSKKQTEKTDVYHYIVISLISLLIIFINITATLDNGDTYSDAFLVSSELYAWNLDYTRFLFGEFGVFIDGIIHYLYRLFILLGSREAFYTHNYDFLQNAKFVNFQLMIFGILAVTHLFCFYMFFYKILKKNLYLPTMIALSALLLYLLTVGHMRYLVGYYPILLIGWLSILAKKNNRISEE
jgi:hypothetical protein